MDELVEVLRRVQRKELEPTMVNLRPSVATLTHEAGPDQLGRSVQDLSRSLSQLTEATHTHLVPERISTMTTEDVPEVMTPVAKALAEVLSAAGALRHRLDGISETSNLLLGRAAAKADERLGLLRQAEREGPPPPFPDAHSLAAAGAAAAGAAAAGAAAAAGGHAGAHAPHDGGQHDVALGGPGGAHPPLGGAAPPPPGQAPAAPLAQSAAHPSLALLSRLPGPRRRCAGRRQRPATVAGFL